MAAIYLHSHIIASCKSQMIPPSNWRPLLPTNLLPWLRIDLTQHYLTALTCALQKYCSSYFVPMGGHLRSNNRKKARDYPSKNVGMRRWCFNVRYSEVFLSRANKVRFCFQRFDCSLPHRWRFIPLHHDSRSSSNLEYHGKRLSFSSTETVKKKNKPSPWSLSPYNC